jgi:hypothetical protein
VKVTHREGEPPVQNIIHAPTKTRINARLIEQIPTADLKPYPEHARTHSARQIEKLARSVARFGIVAPILIDEAAVIIAGHAVVEAAKQLDLSDVPVLRVEHLSDPEKRALRLALNRLAEDAEWDRERLATELRFLADAEFEIDLTGFEVGEIDFRLEEDTLGPDNGSAAEDALPVVAAGAPAVTRRGDVWILGHHRLLCGDPREQTSYEALLRGERAAVAFVDPPHHMSAAKIGIIGAVPNAAASGALSLPESVAFHTTLQVIAAYSIEGAIHFLPTDDEHLSETVAAADAAYGERLAVIVWDRMVGGKGRLYPSQHELVLVEKVGTAPMLNVESRRGGYKRTTVWAYRGLAARDHDQEGPAPRPTIKPVALIADAILDVSRPNEIVLDPFAGCGTTVLAAEKTARRARVIEIDPYYCDVVVRRWQTYAGKIAIHEESRSTFEEMERTPSSAEAAGSGSPSMGIPGNLSRSPDRPI